MASSSGNVSESNDRVLVVERVFDAPRALVFKAWTEPERLMQWWGPKGFKMTYCKMDLRPGGAYRYEMRSADGTTSHRSQGFFREIVEPERLVLDGAWIDENENPGHQTTVTITMDDLGGGKTRMKLHQAFFESVEARDAHNNGWSSSFEDLAEYLAAA
jgi:uncharacterized protein YndB with AHSA1/START domain